MTTAKLDRRSFLRTSAAAATGGLFLGFYLPERNKLGAQAVVTTNAADAKLNAYVHIAPDDTVTLVIAKAEMGQGTVTSLSMLLAEELECNWKKIRTEFPGVDREFGPNQGVVGSASIRSSWESLRRAGATAREMLIGAAAQRWGVDRKVCRAENNSIVNTANNERLTFGSLSTEASMLPVPANLALKDPKDFQLIGKARKRLDTPGKVNGSATFGIDVRLPGMQYAVIARCPVFGGKVANFDATKAKAIPGVKGVVPVPSGIAVIADNTWSAMEGRRALQVQWNEGPVAAFSTPGITKSFAESMSQPGAVARKEGDAA